MSQNTQLFFCILRESFCVIHKSQFNLLVLLARVCAWISMWCMDIVLIDLWGDILNMTYNQWCIKRFKCDIIDQLRFLCWIFCNLSKYNVIWQVIFYWKLNLCPHIICFYIGILRYKLNAEFIPYFTRKYYQSKLLLNNLDAIL